MSLQDMRRMTNPFFYEEYMQGEGIPIVDAVAGVDDVTLLPRKPWARMGGAGTFIQMLGTFQAEAGIYVAEIPGGGALNPERHLYEEEIFILRGRGLTEVWQREGESKVSFEWGEGSVFAVPQNAWHRLVNGSREPAIFLAVTTAPRLLNTVEDVDLVFNCDHQIRRGYAGQVDYFTAGEERVLEGTYDNIWYTNFIPDARREILDAAEQKVAGGNLTVYRMGRNFPHGHISEWPVGMYHKAHRHGPGAILVGLLGKGYVMLWPKEAGIHPYQDGNEDQVVKVEWGPRSIYAPPDGWFHAHFNSGNEPARHIAVYAYRKPIELANEWEGEEHMGWYSVMQGGSLIEYQDEDPEIRRRFIETIGKDGIECQMPPVTFSGQKPSATLAFRPR